MRHFFFLPWVRLLLSLTILMLSLSMSLSSFVAGLIAFSGFLLFFMTRLFGTFTRAVDVTPITVAADNDLPLATDAIVKTS